MKRKTKAKALSWLLSLALVLSLMPTMGLTAHADSDLLYKKVWFFNREYTVIEDHSNGNNSGYVTLLPTSNLAYSPFDGGDVTKYVLHPEQHGYAHSVVKSLLDSWVQPGGRFEREAAYMRSVNLTDEGVTGAKLYLLSTPEAKALPLSVIDEDSNWKWWLRTTDTCHQMASFVFPGSTAIGEAAGVFDVNDSYVSNGKTYYYGEWVDTEQGVRPVFQIDLSKAPYDPEHQAFLYTVTMTAGAHSSPDSQENVTQRGISGSINTVIFNAHGGFVFPETSELYKTENGITVERTSDTQVTVSGTVTSNVDVQIPDAEGLPATAPTITRQPVGLTMNYQDVGRQLNIAASAPAGHTLSYQWYRNTVDSTTGGTPFGYNHDYSYIYEHETPAGTYFFYCVVTARRSDNGSTASVASDTAKVVVNKLAGEFIYDYYHSSAEKYVDDPAFTQYLYKSGDGKVTSYTSSNPEVATVDASGLVTMVGAGVTTITATIADGTNYYYGSHSTSYTLTVKKHDGSISYGKTEIKKVTADAPFTNPLTKAGDGSVSYKSSNTNVATVDASTGEVTILAVGRATITATVTDSPIYAYATKKASYTLIVTKQTQGIGAPDITATYGDTGLKINAFHYGDGGDGAFSYEVVSGDSVTVDQEGNLTIVKPGVTSIRVTAAETQHYAQASKTITVTINKLPAYAATVINVNRPHDGTAKPLATVDESTLVGGTMQYAIGTSAAAAPTSGWSEDIPTATDVGRYYVWSKVVPDAVHTATEPTVVTSLITTYYIERAYENGAVTEARHDVPYSVTFLNAQNMPSTLIEGWYVVNGDVSCVHLETSGDIHLVLMDGKTLTVSQGISVGGTLNVYGQDSGSGKLTVNTYFMNEYAAIDGGALTIHGGEVSANAQHYPGISSNMVTVYAGSLTAVSDNCAGISGDSNGTVSIYGGTVSTQSTEQSGISTGTLILGSGVGLVDEDGYTLVAPSEQEQVTTVRAAVMKTGIGIVTESVSYRSASFNENTGEVAFTENTVLDYKSLDSVSDHEVWHSGWILADKNATISNPRYGSISIDGTVNLIICDGVTVTLDSTPLVLEGNNTLNIYGGAQGTGKLIVNGFVYDAGIGCSYDDDIGGTLAIHGCSIITNCDDGYKGVPGIGVKDVTIYGGCVTATGLGGAGIGSARGVDYDGTVRIYGGDVTAISEKDSNGAQGNGIGAGAGGNDSSTLIIAAGIGLIDGSGHTIVEPQDTLQTVTARESTMKTGVGVALEPVSYMENRTEKSCEEYELFDSALTALEDGWYVVSGTVTVSERISVSGDVKIILCDGSELIGEEGIALTEENTLSIYAQTEGSGKLSVNTEEYNQSAIGTSGYDDYFGTLNVYGGQIYATSSDYSAVAIGDRNHDSGSLYVAGGKLVLANTKGSKALKIDTATLESGMTAYQGYEPNPEDNGDELDAFEISHGDFSRSYVTIISKNAGDPLPDPGMKIVPTVVRLTEEMVNRMDSFDDMPADFTKIKREFAEAWDCTGSDETYLIYNVEEDRYLNAIIFDHRGNPEGTREFMDVDDLKRYMDRGEVYYVTGLTQVSNKQVPELDVISAPQTLEVGKQSSALFTHYTGDGKLRYSVLPEYEEYIDIDPATGVITAKKAGIAYYCVTSSETDNYVEKSLTKTITIREVTVVDTLPTITKLSGPDELDAALAAMVSCTEDEARAWIDANADELNAAGKIAFVVYSSTQGDEVKYQAIIRLLSGQIRPFENPVDEMKSVIEEGGENIDIYVTEGEETQPINNPSWDVAFNQSGENVDISISANNLPETAQICVASYSKGKLNLNP